MEVRGQLCLWGDDPQYLSDEGLEVLSCWEETNPLTLLGIEPRISGGCYTNRTNLSNMGLLSFSMLCLVASTTGLFLKFCKITIAMNQKLHMTKLFISQEVAKSKELKLFSSVDCMFVMLTVRESSKQSFPLTISLIYESSGVRPASLEAQSKG
jgi:hypothetical protein